METLTHVASPVSPITSQDRPVTSQGQMGVPHFNRAELFDRRAWGDADGNERGLAAIDQTQRVQAGVWLGAYYGGDTGS